MVTNTDVLRYLQSMDFPAPKEDIVREAERAGAPPEVLRAHQRIARHLRQI